MDNQEKFGLVMMIWGVAMFSAGVSLDRSFVVIGAFYFIFGMACFYRGGDK